MHFTIFNKALQNVESPTCITAVGLVADLAQSIGSQMGNYWENLLQLLGNALTNADSKN